MNNILPSLISGVVFGILIGLFISPYRTDIPQAIDVYRGRTELEITGVYRDSVFVVKDSVVVFKDKY